MLTVETANSTYEIDMDAQTVTRVPMSGDLRRDGDAITYLSLGPTPIRVGGSMQMVLDLRGDGVRTFRVTSSVLRIIEEP